MIFSEGKQSSVEVGWRQTRLREPAFILKCVIAAAFGKQTQADKMLASARDSGQQGSPPGGVGACLTRERQSHCWPHGRSSPDYMLLESQVIGYHRRGFFLLIRKTWTSCDLRICRVGIVSSDHAVKRLRVRRSVSPRPVSSLGHFAGLKANLDTRAWGQVVFLEGEPGSRVKEREGGPSGSRGSALLTPSTRPSTGYLGNAFEGGAGWKQVFCPSRPPDRVSFLRP